MHVYLTNIWYILTTSISNKAAYNAKANMHAKKQQIYFRFGASAPNLRLAQARHTHNRALSLDIEKVSNKQLNRMKSSTKIDNFEMIFHYP
jgi:hypothetical protein